MFSLFARVSPRVSGLSMPAFAFAPLAGGARDTAPDPVFFLSGMAVLSAGLVVLRAARDSRRVVLRTVPSVVRPLHASVDERDREMLLHALATAAETFYSIAGHLPRDASDRALGKADDLRELVWLNRS